MEELSATATPIHTHSARNIVASIDRRIFVRYTRFDLDTSARSSTRRKNLWAVRHWYTGKVKQINRNNIFDTIQFLFLFLIIFHSNLEFRCNRWNWPILRKVPFSMTFCRMWRDHWKWRDSLAYSRPENWKRFCSKNALWHALNSTTHR